MALSCQKCGLTSATNSVRCERVIAGSLCNGKLDETKVLTIGDAIVAKNASLAEQARKHEVVKIREYNNMERGYLTNLGISKLENAGFRVSKGGKK